ncbi:hypothetical protein CPB84DRAFT_1744310 [Gymnopilus junonius]|uniref:Uncharacterized protein n=1 Tax=Gymnopilus junonius TaxID=109634 RepID=A0A9P5NX02_GYMJU|nr:hypothetical protein CPB84DRAFT_1744310 [Gymnopilus junonius]
MPRTVGMPRFVTILAEQSLLAAPTEIPSCSTRLVVPSVIRQAVKEEIIPEMGGSEGTLFNAQAGPAVIQRIVEPVEQEELAIRTGQLAQGQDVNLARLQISRSFSLHPRCLLLSSRQQAIKMLSLQPVVAPPEVPILPLSAHEELDPLGGSTGRLAATLRQAGVSLALIKDFGWETT